MAESNQAIRLDWFDGGIQENRMPSTANMPAESSGESLVTPNYGELKKPIGFIKLSSISLLEQPFLGHELERRKGFWLLLENDVSDDSIVLIVKIFSKVFKSINLHDRSKLVHLIDTKFMQSEFLMHLKKYLLRVPNTPSSVKSRNSQLWEEVNTFYCDLINVYNGIFRLCINQKDHLPYLYSIVEITETSAIRMQVEQSETICVDFFQAMEKLKSDIRNTLYQTVKRPEPTVPYASTSVHGQIPNTFYYKTMSVFPTETDFTTDMLEKIEPNIIDGAYSDMRHYFDLQFKLLREDCFRPVIQNIKQYMKLSSYKDLKNFRIYNKVYVTSMQLVNNHLGFVVDLSLSDAHSKRHKEDKSFMHGSLLLFTSDNFKTISCATILETIAMTPAECKIAVMFESEMLNDVFSKEFIMVESDVYFEPYHRVLLVLQNYSTDSMPMEKYIVYANTSINPPAYLESDSMYNIKTGTGKEKYFGVLRGEWPDADVFGLDESQMDAFRFALTKEFVVIQGPPGTGKTYLATTIAGVLLRNLFFMSTPMLLICYSNHALDQFMEHLLKYTTSMVRLGGQSKSLILQGHNIQKLPMPPKYMGLINEKKYELKGIYNKISKVGISIEKCNKIILTHDYINQFSKSPLVFGPSHEDPILGWLFDNMYCDVRNIQGRNQSKKENLFEDDLKICFSEEIAINAIETLKKGAADLRLLQGKKTKQKKKVEELEAKIRLYERRLDTLKYMLTKKENRVPLRPFHSIYDLNTEERWSLYFSITVTIQEHLMGKRTELYNQYKDIERNIDEIRDMADTERLASVKVVGMTTTMAAKRHRLLTLLKPFVVIVEEAAEVLETHIVASLTDNCQHLILIGDHQQLRPTSAHYILGRKYNLEVSLFERMLRNGVHSKTLTIQRRMRKEIVDLLVPTIYEKLDSHHMVSTYPDIKGMGHNLYFYKHNTTEETEEDSSSCKNKYEAKWCVALASYLREMGYQPEDITILTSYSAQVSLMIALTKNYKLLDDVFISTVDNFQGQESKIVILSLVRSNAANNIGFTESKNRICVALSRAQQGLYIFGNMDCLEASSSIWKDIKEKLANQGAIGNKLILESPRLEQSPLEIQDVAELESCLKRK